MLAVLALLWARSQFANDWLYLHSPHALIVISSEDGAIIWYNELERPDLGWDIGFRSGPSSERHWSVARFDILIGFEIGVAYWLLIAIACIAAAVRYLYLKNRLPPEGICPKCSYDMHATPDGCPECGHKINQEQT